MATTGGPMRRGPMGTGFEALRRTLAQPVSELVHRETGMAWHRLALWTLRCAAAVVAAHWALQGIVFVADATGHRAPVAIEPTELAWAWVEATRLALDVATYQFAVRRQGRFSLRASRDPFLAFDPWYRRPAVGEMVAAYTLANGLDAMAVLGFGVAGLVRDLDGGMGVAPALARLALGDGLDALGVGLLSAGLLLGACERSTRGRRSRRDAREPRGSRVGAG